MIKTEIINVSPVIVHHRVSGSFSESEAMIGVTDALSVVKQVVDTGERVCVIVDMRGYICEKIEAHKIWTTEFMRHRLLSENFNRVAVVGDPCPQFSAEKEFFETDVLRFFYDINSAYEWLGYKEIASSKTVE